MILIIAASYREASAIAGREGLHPYQWRYAREVQHLQGYSQPEVWIARCWSEQPVKTTFTDPETGDTSVHFHFPIRETLQSIQARLSSVVCA